MSVIGVMVTVFLPGIIAAGIAEKNGIHPAFGFVLGAFFSWPGMVAAAIGFSLMGSSVQHRREVQARGNVAAMSYPGSSRPPRKQAMTAEDMRAAREVGQNRLREHRQRMTSLQREAKILRHNAAAERKRSAAEVAARDALLAAREAEIERLRTALDEAEATQERAEQVERDPWYSDTLATADEALPEILPAGMPRQSFERSSEKPRTLEAGASED